MKVFVVLVSLALIASSEAFFGLGDGLGTIAMMNTLNNRPMFDMGFFSPRQYGAQPAAAAAAGARPTAPAAARPSQQFPMFFPRGGMFGNSGLGQFMGYSMMFDGPF